MEAGAVGVVYDARQLPVSQGLFCALNRVHQDSASRARWAGESRHNSGTRQELPPRTAERDLCAQRAMVGAALAALHRIVTEIDDVAPVHSRTYRNIVSAVDVLRADRMPLFAKKISSDSCF